MARHPSTVLRVDVEVSFFMPACNHELTPCPVSKTLVCLVNYLEQGRDNTNDLGIREQLEKSLNETNKTERKEENVDTTQPIKREFLRNLLEGNMWTASWIVAFKP